MESLHIRAASLVDLSLQTNLRSAELPQPLLTKPDGTCLHTFTYGEDVEIPPQYKHIPLCFALAVVTYQEQVLLVFNRWRKVWELPGGMIDPGETPMQCTIRETLEESGQRIDNPTYVGLMKVELAPDMRWEFGALYRAEISSLAEFERNDEIDSITLWQRGTDLDNFDPLDKALIDIALKDSAQ